jgi:hypothetical protein
MSTAVVNALDPELALSGGLAMNRWPQLTLADRATLDTYIDLSPLGHSDRAPLASMSVTVTAPPRLDRSARRSLAQDAVLYMARQFGFVDLTETTLQTTAR